MDLLSLTLAAKSEINVNNNKTRAVNHMISSSIADDNADDITFEPTNQCSIKSLSIRSLENQICRYFLFHMYRRTEQ